MLFFEDLNGDFRDLFHGTQNIDGQVNSLLLLQYVTIFIIKRVYSMDSNSA